MMDIREERWDCAVSAMYEQMGEVIEGGEGGREEIRRERKRNKKV